MMSKEIILTDNHDGTIIKTVIDDNGVENEYKYDILVGKNIPEEDSIVDYCYFQKEDNLLIELRKSNVDEGIFCSGTCVAMILAITYGDSSITPINVLYWGDESDEDNREVNWTWTKDENGNLQDSGLRAWEQDKYGEDDKQVYDNRYKGENGNYGAIDGSDIENDEQYLKEIKSYLAAGQPVIINVSHDNSEHFVVVVGVEAGVSIEEATLDQLVIFDPGTDQEDKIASFGKSSKGYQTKSYRILTTYPVDSEKKFVCDENGKKTHDPYYVDPIKKEDGSIVPSKTERAIKAIIDFVNKSDLADKDSIIKNMVKTATGEDIAVYENLTVSENGEYLPGEGIAAFDKVTVNVSDRYDEGYKKGGEDMKKIEDIAGGVGEPADIPDGSGGTYRFSGGCIPGLDRNSAAFIATKAGDKVVITSIDSKLYAVIECKYKGVPGNGWMDTNFQVFNLNTGSSVHRECPSAFWRREGDFIRAENIWFEGTRLFVTFLFHRLEDGDRAYTYSFDMGNSTDYIVSSELPVYIRN